MKQASKILAAGLITVLLSLSGYVAVAIAMSPSSDHSVMMEHASTDCLSVCLSTVHSDFVMPVINSTQQLLSVNITQIVMMVMPALLTLIFMIYAARPRPSPNLIALHSNYLE